MQSSQHNNNNIKAINASHKLITVHYYYNRRLISPTVLFAFVALTTATLYYVHGLENGLARTPPMGWLAWERFVCETDCTQYPHACINEALFKDMADKLVDDGFAKLGYTYVNIDDCWSERYRQPLPPFKLDADAKRFPNGIRALADYMHQRNLSLGLYGDCGTTTCQLYPGQLANESSLDGNYFHIDAQTFANEWHIDSFKFDTCAATISKSASICPLMGDELNATGRPVLFSCSWPAYENDLNITTDFEFVASKCNLWRAFGDIEDSWGSVLDTIDWFVYKQLVVIKHHKPGAWFDADQLVIGNFGLSKSQERAQMAIWSIWSVPLYMSNDLRSLAKDSSKLLRNKWLIEVNQDKHGVFGLMVAASRRSHYQAFIKPVEPTSGDCPSYVIVYLNRVTLGDWALMSFNLSKMIEQLHLALFQADPVRFVHWFDCGRQANTTQYTMYDLLSNNAELDTKIMFEDNLNLMVEPSGVRAIKLVQVKRF